MVTSYLQLLLLCSLSCFISLPLHPSLPLAHAPFTFLYTTAEEIPKHAFCVLFTDHCFALRLAVVLVLLLHF